MSDAAAVAVLDQAGDNASIQVGETMEKLKTENLALHSGLVVKKTAHAYGSMDSVRLLHNMKKSVAEED